MRPNARTTAPEFIDWAISQPEVRRHALVDGCVVAIGAHTLAALRAREDVAIALRTAMRLSGAPGTVLADGSPIVVNATTVYPADVALLSGGGMGELGVQADAPVVICDVLSPLQISVDTARKLSDYFSLPSVRHYLLVDVERRLLIQHSRATGPRSENAALVETRVLRAGVVQLDGVGLTIHAEDLFVSA